MLTAYQQLAFSFLTLLFGILSQRVAAQRGDTWADRRTLAWRVAAGYFLVIGAYSLAQSVVAFVGVSQGAGSLAYRVAVEWGLPGTVGRSAAGVAFALLLLHAQRRDPAAPRLAARAAAPLTAVLSLGLTVTLHGAGFTAMPRMGTAVAVLSAATALVLFAALLLTLMREWMDALLWLALTAYAMKEVLSVSLFSILVWWGLIDARASLRLLYWLSIAVTAGMCAAGAWRLHLLAAGREVPSLLERVRGVRRPVIGWDRIG